MEEKTKDILIKLFRKYAQTNRFSETQFLTEQDFRYLIHDKSFPVELPVKPANGEQEDIYKSRDKNGFLRAKNSK